MFCNITNVNKILKVIFISFLSNCLYRFWEYRFKIGTIGEKKPEEWIVVENQHEPLVDRKTFDIVQRKLKSR